MPTSISDNGGPRIDSDTPLVESEGLRIYGLKLGASNAYLIETPAGVTLVDAGMPTSARKVRRKLENCGRADDLRRIFITHSHIDHFGAAAELRKSTGAQIIIHEGDAEALAKGRTELGSVRNWNWSRLPMPVVERLITIQPTPADRIAKDGERITDGGLDATVLQTPGHTRGSSILMVRDPVTGAHYAFVGDLISTSGGIHVQSTYAQDWSQVGPSVEKLRALAPEIVFPGHGNTVATHAELAQLILTGPAAPRR